MIEYAGILILAFFAAVLVYLFVFLTSVLGAPAVFVGFIEGFADALASVLKIYFGWFSDKIGKRKLPATMLLSRCELTPAPGKQGLSVSTSSVLKVKQIHLSLFHA